MTFSIAGRCSRTGMLGVEPDGVAKLRAVRQVSQVSHAHEQRLCAMCVQVADELRDGRLGDGVLPGDDLIVEVNVDDQLGGGTCGQFHGCEGHEHPHDRRVSCAGMCSQGNRTKP